jgi:hypothetical protein
LDINDLIPRHSTQAIEKTTDYDWQLGEVKHTLKEFEKPIYYSNGDYPKANTTKFAPNLLTGYVDLNKQIPRDSGGPGHFLFSSQGFRASGHLSAPNQNAMMRKFARLGHVKESKLVGWDQQKPRDNSMYYVGEGQANLKKMDTFVKKATGRTHVFSSEVINDKTLQKLKKRKVRPSK